MDDGLKITNVFCIDFSIQKNKDLLRNNFFRKLFFKVKLFFSFFQIIQRSVMLSIRNTFLKNPNT